MAPAPGPPIPRRLTVFEDLRQRPPMHPRLAENLTAYMNLAAAMNLAGRNLVHCLCPSMGYLPYFKIHIGKWVPSGPRPYTYQTEPMENYATIEIEMVCHNIGRWWDAMLRLEDATGFAIPLEQESAMLATLLRHCDNDDGLCLDPPDLPIGNPGFELHSMRETLLAFNALVQFRH